ncbi:hypothetical protein ACVGWF_06115, partial [Enterobacter asburiae]
VVETRKRCKIVAGAYVSFERQRLTVNAIGGFCPYP